MPIKHFTVPINNFEPFEDEMNNFISSHRITDIKKEFSQSDRGVFWCYGIEYLTNSGADKSGKNRIRKIDYKALLTEEQFKIFSRLREIRKQLADEDKVPAYAVFTDEEIAGISKLEELTLSKIKSVEGIGEKKVERYGQKLLDIIEAEHQDEEKGKSD